MNLKLQTFCALLGAFSAFTAWADVPFKVTTLNGEQFAKGTSWYSLRIGNNQSYITDNGTQNFISLSRATTQYADEDLWCFVGDENNGFSIYNKKQGTKKTLSSSSTMGSLSGYSGKGGSTYPVLTPSDKLPDGHINKWDFSSSNKISGVDGYFMSLHGTTFAVNNFGGLGKLAFWAEGKDAGSTITFELAATDFEVLANNGRFTASNPNKTWHSVWESNVVEGFRLGCGANNMTIEGNYIVGYTGQSGRSTYSLTAPQGMHVIGYSFDVKNAKGDNGYSLTLKVGEQTFKTSSKSQTISVEGLDESVATFELSGANKGVVFQNFIIYLKRSSEVPEYSFEVFPTLNPQAIPYRIPAIAKAYNGDLIAVADYRHSRVDIGMADKGRIDLHARISKDNGKTWGDIFSIIDGKGNQSSDFMHVGFGDPCIVADRSSSKVLVLSCAGDVSFFNGTRKKHQNIAHFISEDNGQTWSAPVDLAETIYEQFDKSIFGPVNSMFIGSGKISQSETVKVGDYYRLYCAVLVRDVNATFRNFVLFSDDFGTNWKVLGGVDVSPIPDGGDEPKADELPDGSVIISSRCHGGRKYNIFNFSNTEKAEGKWGTMAFSGKENKGVIAENNSTNGEILFVPVMRKADNKKMFVAFQSVPFGRDRANVGIYYKELADLADFVDPAAFAANWDGRHQATSLPSAYSTMCWQADSTIAFLFEESTHTTSGGGYTMIYKNYSVEEITDSAYTYCPDVDRDAFVASNIDAKLSNYVITDKAFVGSLKPGALDGARAQLDIYKKTSTKDNYEKINQELNNLACYEIENGSWYRLRNSNRQNGTLYLNPESDRYSTATSNLSDANQYFTFVPSSRKGCFYIKNGNFENYLGKLGKNETQPTIHTSSDEAGVYQIVGHLNGKSEIICTNKTGSNSGLHLAGDNKRLVPWVPSEEASLWFIEPIDTYDITIPTDGYTTLCLPFAINLPKGVTAYTAKNNTIIDGVECVYIEEVSGLISAKQPVIIQGESGSYKINIATDSASDEYVEHASFKGTLKEMTVNNKQLYLLQKGQFTKRTSASGKVKANSAYYVVDSESEILPLTTQKGTPVGIDNVISKEDRLTFYDLNGGKVTKPKKGIYVTSRGDKVYVK